MRVKKTFIIRVEAERDIGTGHLMRCLALAQAWKDEGVYPLFAVSNKTLSIEARLKAEKFELVHLSVDVGSHKDAIQTGKLAQQHKATWVVVDGYMFGTSYQRIIKGFGCKLLIIDDAGDAEYYYADIILNQNLHARKALYINREPYTQLLLGPRFILLRREFLPWRGWKRKIPDVARKILVTLGGSDSKNFTLMVIKALSRLNVSGMEAIVVVGPQNIYGDTLKQQVLKEKNKVQIRLERNVQNMAKLMMWADIGITSGGTTVWEMAFMELPTIVGITSPVEEFLVEGLKKKELFIPLGWFTRVSVDKLTEQITRLLDNKNLRENMAVLGQSIVDGYGVNRVLETLNL